MEKWFHWHKVSFLICTPSIEFTLDLMKRIKDEVDKEEAMKCLFESCLLDWRGIEDQEKYPREIVLHLIWNDTEIRTFILDGIIQLLSLEVNSVEKMVTTAQKTLFNRGLLKS
jgi:hypothetical protein